jgi:hypothetical protein
LHIPSLDTPRNSELELHQGRGGAFGQDGGLQIAEGA